MKKDDFLSQIILEIDSTVVTPVKINRNLKTFELRPYKFLTSNLSGGVGALLIRAILHELHIDEHRLFRWRLENKLLQYLIFDHYIPDSMPKTISLSKILNRLNGVAQVKVLFKSGFFLKTTLGCGSGSKNNFDRTAEFEDIISSAYGKYYYDEKWILQKKVELTKEFRVHTFNRDVIYGLTFIIQGSNSLNDNFRVENFIKNKITKLPSAIVEGSLIGWDIGLTSTGIYYIIEANFTGFHPEYALGFQTTGYTEYDGFGPIVCAWINVFFKKKYGTYINSIEYGLLSKFQFYNEFIFYSSILEPDHLTIAGKETKDSTACTVIYLGDDVHALYLTLTRYFQTISFTEIYYIIVSTKYSNMVNNLFYDNNHILIINQNELFTEDQYRLIQHLSYDRRKQISCFYALRRYNQHSYVIL